MAKTSRLTGLEGESRAAAALEEKGMVLVDKNVRSPAGEIDLVLLDGESLVFVEVKNWPANGPEDLELAINGKKRRRIIETAKYFLASNRKYNYSSIRFDVVFLRPGEPIIHLVSAFTESA